jgi:hypothetical protein
MSNGSRLAHPSCAAFRRRMQMSNHTVFVFVEGWRDRYFYDRICESICAARAVEYDVCCAHEFSGPTGGKLKLLDFFAYLRRVGSLVDDFKGKKTLAIFFLDKDVDDLLAASKLSEHIVYTKFYSIENHLVAHGDLVRALASAATLDERSVRGAFSSGNEAWRREAAEHWRDWIKLCLFARTRNLGHRCNYGVGSSRINDGAYARVDPQRLATYVADLRIASGLTAIGFQRVFDRLSRSVDRLFDEGNHDLIFNGKWYQLFLAEKADAIAAGRNYNRNGLPDRVLACLQLTLDFGEAWAHHFKGPLQVALGNLVT